jgi:hypothetical protein
VVDAVVEGPLGLPAASVAVAVKLKAPSVGVVRDNIQLVPVTVAVRVVLKPPGPLTLTATVLPASVVPDTVSVRVLLKPGALRVGAAGATVSIMVEAVAEGLLTLPAGSVAVAVKVKVPSAGAE